jgi:hypothetical protein
MKTCGSYATMERQKGCGSSELLHEPSAIRVGLKLFVAAVVRGVLAAVIVAVAAEAVSAARRRRRGQAVLSLW